MKYTPAAVNLLVAACDRADLERRADFIADMRTALYAKDADKVIRDLRNRAKRG